MVFEHYIRSGSKLLRCGYTTGTCGALAAAGAATLLLTGRKPETLSLRTPKGLVVTVEPEQFQLRDQAACCGVRKDGGHDLDATDGALILAEVEFSSVPGVTILGGTGVGRVTKPGLDQPVGEAAINHVPRQMIMDAVAEVCRLGDYQGGLKVTISVPEGEAIARRTFNPELGIAGGISILGTSGIVEPMSVQALVDSITLEIRQKKALGFDRLILTPGNYGTDFLRQGEMEKRGVPIVKCSNFVGDALDEAGLQGFRQVLLVGHIGKFVKLAGGIMNTHSRTADCRAELFCAHGAICGAARETCQGLMQAATADACLDILEQAGLKETVMESLLAAIQHHLERRAEERYQVGIVLFSNVYGYLGKAGKTEGIWDI